MSDIEQNNKSGEDKQAYTTDAESIKEKLNKLVSEKTHEDKESEEEENNIDIAACGNENDASQSKGITARESTTETRKK